MTDISVAPNKLYFKTPAGTSRGIYTERQIYYITIEENGKKGVGEIAPLPSLSIDYTSDLEEKITTFCNDFRNRGVLDYNTLRQYPSILLGFETAIQQLNSHNNMLWENDFSKGEKGLPINGLIWMAPYSQMYRQIKQKISENYGCIKIKVGAIDFSQECDLISRIRKDFGKSDIQIRLDANGGFKNNEALDKLKYLSQYDIHSIEQPIMADNLEYMAELCEKSPIDIGLDEELIKHTHREDKLSLIKTIKPKYIILKPSLHGGFYGCEEWIEIADKQNVGWWITSALESNIGLNAIAQWCGSLNITTFQGLGTGNLYKNNINMDLEIKNGCLWKNNK